MTNIIERLNLIIQKRSGLITIALILAVVLAGFFYSFYLGDSLRFLPDEADYVLLAQHLSEQGIYSLDGESPTAFRPPGYPLLLAFFDLLGAGIVHFRMLNFILLGLSILLVYRILKSASSSYGATIGILFVIGYPVFFYTAGTLYPQTLAAFLLLVVLYLLTKSEIKSQDALAAGLALGYVVITVPLFLFSAPIFALWIWYAKRNWTRGVLFFLLSSLVVVGAWTARNYYVFGKFVPVSTNSGFNLLVGNSSLTKPNSGTDVDISTFSERADNLSEVERDRYYRSEALQYIRDNPLESARLYFFKFVNYFNFRNNLVTSSEESSLKDLIMLFTYGPLLGVFLLRIIFFRGGDFSALDILLISLYVFSALATAVFFSRIRFRMPFDYVLIIIDAKFLSTYVRVALSRTRGTSGVNINPGGSSP